MIKRAYSYIIAAMIWGIPGINISIKGVRTYFIMTSDAVCRLIPDIPITFTASFYSGLGPMPVTASLRFIAHRIRG